MRRSLRLTFAALATLAAGACSHMPDIGAVLPNASEAAAPGLAPRERVRVAIELLGEGEEERAKTELEAALEEQPNMSMARRLLEQIDANPHTLLGENARAYTVRPGETMSVLAERFLGDSLLFYALARYNGLDAPNQLSAGQALMIPQRTGVRVASTSVRGGEAPVLPPPTIGAATAVRGVDPVRASQLRLQALQNLNAGQVDRAVALLRQAQSFDAANAAIQRDLDRALRLQASLRTSGGGS